LGVNPPPLGVKEKKNRHNFLEKNHPLLSSSHPLAKDFGINILLSKETTCTIEKNYVKTPS